MATLRKGWVMPKTPEGTCSCGNPLVPVAYGGNEFWELYWSCDDDCEPFEDMYIEWPYGDGDLAKVAELTSLGFVVID